MAILTERKTWTKPRPSNETRRSSDLTPEEQANVKVALRFLMRRHGGMKALGVAMGANPRTVQMAMGKRGGVSAGIALRAARVAGVGVEGVLAGRYPPEGACPHCRRFDK